ncbi:hypothetical protein [Ktedonobacter robiniae]|uniref:hypothetical protein n=1 Tax=Ktedonobacter robiniae TaxID=2778365 RepID=UPI0019161496|nr:hypothetical protein [Ktedonobacter robiniae]
MTHSMQYPVALGTKCSPTSVKGGIASPLGGWNAGLRGWSGGVASLGWGGCTRPSVSEGRRTTAFGASQVNRASINTKEKESVALFY